MYIRLKKDCEILPIDRNTAKYIISKRYHYAVDMYIPTTDSHLTFGFKSLDKAQSIAECIAKNGYVTCLGLVLPSDILLDPSDAVLQVLIRYDHRT